MNTYLNDETYRKTIQWLFNDIACHFLSRYFIENRHLTICSIEMQRIERQSSPWFERYSDRLLRWMDFLAVTSRNFLAGNALWARPFSCTAVLIKCQTHQAGSDAYRIKAVKGLRLWQVSKKKRCKKKRRRKKEKKKKERSERIRCGVCGGIKSPEGKLLSSRRNAIMVEPCCKSLELILRYFALRLRFLPIVPSFFHPFPHIVTLTFSTFNRAYCACLSLR